MEDDQIEESESDESSDQEEEENDQGETVMDVDDETLKKLQKQVEENPYDYQGHVSLIGALRNLGELDILREARQRFASTFPLAPNLWLVWIKDERRVDTPWDEIRGLFERAVKDYLSVQIWLEYVQTACANLSPLEMRELCERALSHVGLHVPDGRLLWDAYRIFESALATASNPSGTFDPTSPAAERLLQIFKRQLCIPISGLEDTRQEFLNTFGEAKFDASMTQAYNSATEELKSLSTYEAALEANNSFEAYSRYLDFEEGGSETSALNGNEMGKKQKEKRTPNVARLQCLYERAITDHCLNVDLWLRYVNWLNKRFSSSNSIVDVVLPVNERAIRNCTWSTKLWVQYALACERGGGDWLQRADAVLSRATNDGGYTSAAEATELWLTWAYQKRRAADNGICGYEHVAEIFEKGANFLKEKFGDRNWDSSTLYRRSWASYLAFPRKGSSDGADLSKARSLWKDILASDGNGRLASVWLDYYQQVERRCGDTKEARKTLYCALNSVTDFPEYIASTLRQFELEEGSLHDLDEAEERIKRQTTRLEERKLQQHALTSSSKQHQQQQQSRKKNEPRPTEKQTKRKRADQPETTVAPKKPKPEPRPELPPAEIQTRRPNAQPDAEAHQRTVFISNLGFFVTEERVKEIFEAESIAVKEVRLAMVRPGRSKGFGHVEFESVESVGKALAMDRHSIDGRPMYISEYKGRGGGGKATNQAEKAIGIGEKSAAAEKYHFNAGLEKKKLFVKNIPKHATEADLKVVFEPHGELKSIRLVTFTSGQSKGFAYVEYADEESASRALVKVDGTVLFGNELSVAISNPPPRRLGGGDHFETTSRVQGSSGKGDKELMPPPTMLLPRSVAASRKPKLNL